MWISHSWKSCLVYGSLITIFYCIVFQSFQSCSRWWVRMLPTPSLKSPLRGTWRNAFQQWWMHPRRRLRLPWMTLWQDSLKWVRYSSCWLIISSQVIFALLANPSMTQVSYNHNFSHPFSFYSLPDPDLVIFFLQQMLQKAVSCCMTSSQLCMTNIQVMLAASPSTSWTTLLCSLAKPCSWGLMLFMPTCLVVSRNITSHVIKNTWCVWGNTHHVYIVWIIDKVKVMSLVTNVNHFSGSELLN